MIHKNMELVTEGGQYGQQQANPDKEIRLL
jgi:hypothetical protein